MQRDMCIEKALIFIEENLKTRISLEDIADAANYSQWYFHRSFRILTGYSVYEYLRKRRIYEAAHELLYGTKAISVLATEYQFESQAAFTRSFKAIYGISPGKFRKKSNCLLRFPPISLKKGYRLSKTGEKEMNPRFEKKPPFTVLGVYTKCSPSSTLHKLWEEFGKRHHEFKNVLEPDKGYQVCVFDPENPDAEENLFIAGVSVSEAPDIPPNMILHEVPAAEYAVFEHRGSMDKMHQSYEYIFGIWLPGNGYVMADSDCLEIYDSRFIVNHPDSVFEIWIPIKKA